MKFRTLARLGSGGMGEVFLAELETGERVALKRIRGGLHEDPRALAHFEREARICALLHHPNIVALRAFGRDDDGPYLALEYVDGCSAGALLKALKESGRHVPLPMLLGLASDCALGLSYAHAFRSGELQGVIHRDISPENVLIRRDGVALLADFGIARVSGATRMTDTGVAKGKFGYMAPEVYEGKEADAATDLFALAATLFHLGCGVPPFHGVSDAEVMRATLQAQPPRLSHLRPGVPPKLDEWIDAALSKDRQRRPPLATLTAALAQAPAGDPSRARREAARCVDAVSQPLDLAVAPTDVGLAPTVRGGARPVRSRRALSLAALAVLGTAGAWAFRWMNLPAVVTAPAAPALLPPAPVVVATPAPPPPVSEPNPEPVPPPLPKRHPGKARTSVTIAPEPEQEPPAPADPTRLWVHVRPWAKVFVDGESIGTTPLAPFDVSPGAHSVILVNDSLHVRRVFQIDAVAHQVSELRASLEDEQPERLHEP